jgi:hypothetical protein
MSAAAKAPGFYVVARASAFEPEARAMFIAALPSARRHFLTSEDERAGDAAQQPRRARLRLSSRPSEAAAQLPEHRRKAIAAGVAESWGDPEVAASRARRYMAFVDGVAYRSLAAALRALGATKAQSLLLSTGLRRRMQREGGRCDFAGRQIELVARRRPPHHNSMGSQP